jgi:pyruvate dehydrogenase E2 component (dihydrolipoamide acetyltransferase)
MTQLTELTVPDLGDIKDATILEVFVRAGAEIRVDETTVTLETDKAAIDVPSTANGTIREVRVKVGDLVKCGTVLALIENLASVGATEKAISSDESAPAATLVPAISTVGEQAQSRGPEPVDAIKTSAHLLPPTDGLPHASPSVRRFARQLGVDLKHVAGSGPKGRIQQGDIEGFVKLRLDSAEPSGRRLEPGLELPPWPQVDFAKFGSIERVAISKVKKRSGANLTRNWIQIPHVTNFDEADITDLEAFRSKVNQSNTNGAPKLTMLAFLIKASETALKLHPLLNASLDGDEIVLKRYFHIGFAVDTPNGLLVPVIRDVETKGLQAIAAEVAGLARQARKGELKLSDMQGGCFTVSSLGGIGGTGSTPIINAPEVAILGAARSKLAPVWNREGFEPRLMLPLSLTWDHRAIDGAEAARFLITVSGLLNDFRRVLL